MEVSGLQIHRSIRHDHCIEVSYDRFMKFPLVQLVRCKELLNIAEG